jgi:hypothetical protein
MKSKIDNDDPRIETPYTDKEEPSLPKLRTLIDDPIEIKSTSDIDDPNLLNP